MPLDLDNIPEGTWVRRKGDTVIIGASLKDKLGENLFIGLIALLMTSLFIYITSIKLTNDEISIYFGGFIIVFCLYLLFFMLYRALISLFGRVEIRLYETEGTIFQGIRNVGRTRTFIYEKTHAIDIYIAASSGSMPTQLGIKIEAEKTIIFAGYLKEKKVEFIIKMIKVFLKDGEKIRNLLPPDLIHNLIA